MGILLILFVSVNKPEIVVNFSPSYEGIAFTQVIDLKISLVNFAFNSDYPPSFYLNKKRYSYHKGMILKVRLKRGVNSFRIVALDSGHRIVKSFRIICRPAVKVTISEIEHSPESYIGEILELQGIAWGWMMEQPELANGLSTANGNTALSRNDGNFSDGTGVIFFPIAPYKKFKCVIFGKLKFIKSKWIFKPFFIKKL